MCCSEGQHLANAMARRIRASCPGCALFRNLVPDPRSFSKAGGSVLLLWAYCTLHYMDDTTLRKSCGTHCQWPNRQLAQGLHTSFPSIHILKALEPPVQTRTVRLTRLTYIHLVPASSSQENFEASVSRASESYVRLHISRQTA